MPTRNNRGVGEGLQGRKSRGRGKSSCRGARGRRRVENDFSHEDACDIQSESENLEASSTPTAEQVLPENSSSQDFVNSGVAQDGLDLVSLAERLDPEVPGAINLHEHVCSTADGWDSIDTLSVWECLLSQFTTLETIPSQFKEQWARSYTKVLFKLKNCTDETEKARSLKWWMFLPQALLRKPIRGGRAGIRNIKKRFDCVVNDNYEELIRLWRLDREAAERKKEGRRQKPPDKSAEDPKKTRQAVSLISKGYISKATNRMISNGVADINNPATKASLGEKYPPRGRPMPEFVTKGEPVESMRGLRDVFLNLKGGTAPGTGGMRPEYLVSLAETWEEGHSSWELAEDFSMNHVKGDLPPWWYKVMMTVETVGLFKTADQNPKKVRPVGMRNPWIKATHKLVITENKEQLIQFLQP